MFQRYQPLVDLPILVGLREGGWGMWDDDNNTTVIKKSDMYFLVGVNLVFIAPPPRMCCCGETSYSFVHGKDILYY